jgi:hypothetical protein
MVAGDYSQVRIGAGDKTRLPGSLADGSRAAKSVNAVCPIDFYFLKS